MRRGPTGAVRPRSTNWGAAIGILLIVALSGGLTWAWGSRAVDGYRATHRGVQGTLVVTAVQRGRGEDAGSDSVTGDFTPSAGGQVRHGVSFDTRGALVGYTYQVCASGPDARRVYPMASREWIVNTVGAGIVGATLLAALLALGVWGIRARPGGSTVDGPA
jgi:hypothetical protein